MTLITITHATSCTGLTALIEAAGEAAEWFSHPAGFLFCRGSRKAEAAEPSAVKPLDLVRATLAALSDGETEGRPLMSRRIKERPTH